jgi:hypothetical protein
VETDIPMAEIQATMWGLFFEDINFAADGGFYTELIKNRSFEFPEPREGWTVEDASFFNDPVQIVSRSGANNANPRFARIPVEDNVCMLNHGFRGPGIQGGNEYLLTFMASTISNGIKLKQN